MKKFVILIPTYNEAISIVELLEKLTTFRKLGKFDFDALIIDDNSPDKTADLVAALGLSWGRPGPS